MCPARMSKYEAAIRVVLEFIEAFNRHDVAGMVQLMSEDCVFEDMAPAPDGRLITGKEDISQYWQDFIDEAPHAHVQIEEIFSSGFRCVMRWRFEWENEAGEKEHLRGVDLFNFKEGLICEMLSYCKG